MRFPKREEVAILFTLSIGIHALENVTVVPLPNDCSAYPKYNPSTQESGPWIPVADSLATAINGLGISVETFTTDGIDQYGFMILPKGTAPLSPPTTLRCANKTLQASLPPRAGTNTTNTTTTWTDVVVSADPNWQAAFGFGQYIYPAVGVRPYAHYVAGQRQPGVFLGAGNSTRWRFKHIWGGVVGDYFLLRLLGGDGGAWRASSRRQVGPPVVDDRDYEGFLRVV